jgi:hypothetical protein
MTTALSPGGECDAWCTKCKRDTLHNIVAMEAKGVKPAKVQCRSCQGAHKYRVPKAEAAAAKKTTRARKKSTDAKASAAPTPAAVYKRWEELVGKKAGITATRYKVTANYNSDDVIEHAHFGLGFVTEEVAWNRIKVLFQDAERTLLANHGQSPPVY